jgi:hypothetical protein
MKRLVPIVLAAVLLGSTGCHLFSKKKKEAKPVDNPNVAVDVESDFMHRWIDKRTSDLVALGVGQGAARAQAQAEFKVKFNYTTAAQKLQ